MGSQVGSALVVETTPVEVLLGFKLVTTQVLYISERCLELLLHSLGLFLCLKSKWYEYILTPKPLPFL